MSGDKKLRGPAAKKSRGEEVVEVVDLEAEEKERKLKQASNKKASPWIHVPKKSPPGSQFNSPARTIRAMPSTSASASKPVIRAPKKASQVERLQAAVKLQSYEKEEARKRQIAKIKYGAWVDRNFPSNTEELFVHKKKVEEVKLWLKTSMGVLSKTKEQLGQTSKICLLSGPSGSGKTATLFLAAKEMNVEIKEWINPMTFVEYNPNRLGQFDPDEIQGKSQFEVFSEFLFRSSRYNTLKIEGRPRSADKIVVVEDFPNTFYRNAEMFHNCILRKYDSIGLFPVVFIIPDSSSRETSTFSLFPKNIIQELNICSISFNAVAPTYMVKFMSTVCSKEGVFVDKSVLESIAAASGGDIRCAINTLQFKLSPMGGLSSNFGFKLPPIKGKGKTKGANKNTPVSDQDVQKDETLFLFRALGKILYSKRSGLENVEPSKNVPSDAVQFLREHALDDNPEHVVEKIEVQADSFLGFLQQNYVPFFGNMEDIVLASGFMADSEFMLSRWPFDDSGTVSKSYKEKEAREEIALLVASRGVMYSNMHKTKSEWRPLRKPILTDVKTQIKKSVDKVRQNFLSEGVIQSNYYSEVLPFYSKLIRRCPNHWNLEEKYIINQIATINKQNGSKFHDTLQEKDVAVEDDDEDDNPNYLEPDDNKKQETVAKIDNQLSRFQDVDDEDDDGNYEIECYSSDEESSKIKRLK